MCTSEKTSYVSYRDFRHPDGFGLLVADLFLQALVPAVWARHEVNTSWKESVRRNTVNRCATTGKKKKTLKEILNEAHLRKGGCSAFSSSRPESKDAWSSCWSWGCTSASWTWHLCGCVDPRTAPWDDTGCSWASPLQWEWCPAGGACPGREGGSKQSIKR